MDYQSPDEEVIRLKPIIVPLSTLNDTVRACCIARSARPAIMRAFLSNPSAFACHLRHRYATALVASFLVIWMTMGPRAQAAPLVDVQIGISLVKPPYILEPGQGGMEYDIADKALAASGYRMIAQQLPPARALALLRIGKLDGMLTVDEGIGGDTYFSDTYMHFQNVATTLARRRIQLHSIEDLSAYSVAAFQNASLILGPRFKELAARHPEYKEHSQQITQNRLLYTGRVDVVVGDRLIFRYLNRQVEPSIDASQALVHHPIFPPSPRKAAFRDAALRDAFNRGLRTIRQNGAYAAIVKKYQE
jgi:polar amino acid transport system substrate-binding protein